MAFLLLSVDQGGGITKTAVTVANGLADEMDVEIISLFRFRARPPFPVDPRVRVSYLKDERGSGPDEGRLSGREEELSGQPSRLLPDNTPTSALTDELLQRRLSRLDVDAVVSNRPVLHEAAARFLPRNTALLAVEHSTFDMRGPAQRNVLKEHRDRIDAVVALTEHERSAYAAFLEDDGKVVTIPNAVPYDVGDPPSALDSQVIIAAGSLNQNKGFDRLISAFAPLADDFPEWQVHIYGRGGERASLDELIGRAGLAGQVRLMGFDPNLRTAMTGASFLAMTSHFEAFPMVLLEAMACGLPVVSFDCPNGPRHLIRDGENGLLVPNDDLEAYTTALRTLMEDVELRKRLASGAVNTIEKSYTVDTVLGRWKQLVEQLTSRGR